MNNKLQNLLAATAIAGFLYLMVSGITWQIRNPTANQATLFTHPPQILTFQKLEKFQGNK